MTADDARRRQREQQRVLPRDDVRRPRRHSTARSADRRSSSCPAILAWQAADPARPDHQRRRPERRPLHRRQEVTALGGGNYHYEFAVHNLNSDRSGRGFTVDFPAGTTISNAGFQSTPVPQRRAVLERTDVDHRDQRQQHQLGDAQPSSVNPNANALRWGTSYNFWFDATAGDRDATSRSSSFKPEPCPADPVVDRSGQLRRSTPAAAFDNPTLTAPVAGPSGRRRVDSSVPIGFTFNFYGTNYTTVNICTNGFLSFTSANTQSPEHVPAERRGAERA